MINFKAKPSFIAALDRALREIGYPSRSQFIREAVREKLQRMGLPVPASEASAPMRRKDRSAFLPKPELNDAVSSAQAIASMEEEKTVYHVKRQRGRGRSRP
jgi:Arc/MetJ-type ribon-helix-helix transcriptional regulator